VLDLACPPNATIPAGVYYEVGTTRELVGIMACGTDEWDGYVGPYTAGPCNATDRASMSIITSLLCFWFQLALCFRRASICCKTGVCVFVCMTVTEVRCTLLLLIYENDHYAGKGSSGPCQVDSRITVC
jgi:hypothetical protein